MRTMNYLKGVALLLLLGVVLVPELVKNGDLFDLITIFPFGGKILDGMATALNFSGQLPTLKTPVSTAAEILKVFFVAPMRRFTELVFTEWLKDGKKAFGTLGKLAVNIATVCLASLFFSAIWDLLGMEGMIIFIVIMFGINIFIAAARGKGGFLGGNGILATILLELLTEIAQTLFVIILVIGVCIIIVSHGTASFFASGLCLVLCGLILLMGLDLIVHS